jgi:hypothetical protein
MKLVRAPARTAARRLASEGRRQPDRGRSRERGDTQSEREARGPARRDAVLAKHEADAERGQARQVRAERHRAHDQDRLVVVDADRGDEPCDRHDHQVGERQPRVFGGVLEHLVPDDGVRTSVPVPDAPLVAADLDEVDPAIRERAPVGRDPDLAQPHEHLVGPEARRRLRRGRPGLDDGTGHPDHVADALVAPQRPDRGLGEVGRDEHRQGQGVHEAE